MISMWLRRLLPCKFSSCDACLGCRCGKKGGSKKAEVRANDLALQAQQRAVAEQQRVQQQAVQQQQIQQQLYQPSPSQLDIETMLKQLSGQTGEQLFRQTSPTANTLTDLIQRRLTQTPEQLFRGISPTADTLANQLQGQLTQTPEQLFRGISPLAGQYADVVGQQLGAPPQINFQDMLGPELQLASQQIAAEANRRGIVGSGLQLEQLGRTGAELAIREAGLRQQNALVNQQLAAQSRQQVQGLLEAEQGLRREAVAQGQQLTSAEEGLRSDALAQGVSLADLQNRLGQGARGQYIDYNTLLRNQQLAGAQQGLSAYQQGTGLAQAAYQQGQELRQPFDQASLEALQQRVRQSQQNVAGFGKLAADAVAIALAGPTGGTSLLAIPAIHSFGGGARKPQSLFSGGGGSTDAQFMQALNQLGLGNTQSGALAQQRYIGGGAGNYPELSYLKNYPPTKKNIFGQDQPVVY